MNNTNYYSDFKEIKDFIAIDFETANSSRSSVCEIGLSFVEEGKITKTLSRKVKPKDNQYDYFNIQVHGITPESTANKPEFDVIWNELRPLINNKILVAHNAAFDMYVLRDVLDLYGLEYPDILTYCSYSLSKKIFPGLFSYNLASLSNHFNIDLQHHSAESDSRACAEIFLKFFKEGSISNFSDIPEKYKILPGIMKSTERRYSGPSTIRANKSGSNTSVDARKITGDASKHKPDNLFYDQYVVFTGTLSSMVRKEAMQVIADIGGYPENGITANTNFLVVGQQNFKVVGESGLSGKQKEALKRLQNGQDIEIISEDDFIKNI